LLARAPYQSRLAVGLNRLTQQRRCLSADQVSDGRRLIHDLAQVIYVPSASVGVAHDGTHCDLTQWRTVVCRASNEADFVDLGNKLAYLHADSARIHSSRTTGWVGAFRLGPPWSTARPPPGSIRSVRVTMDLVPT